MRHGPFKAYLILLFAQVCWPVTSLKTATQRRMASIMKTTIALTVCSIVSFGTAHCLLAADNPAAAVAVIHPTSGQQCYGIVRFTQTGDSVRVVADLEGLKAGQKHAFHIHQYGDCSSPDGMSAGGHYNPEGHPHGLPDAENRHAGDLGNVQADDQGKAHYEITVNNITIAGTKNPIIGRAVIVHAKVDDGGQPVGNAGARIGCGVIGIANPGK
jgi:Cu-Zn family superoxide dismutase